MNPDQELRETFLQPLVSENHISASPEKFSHEQALTIMREAIGVAPEDLRDMDISSYSEKLRVISNTEPEIISEYLEVIVDKYITHLSENGSSQNQYFHDAFDIGNQTRTALWLMTHGEETVNPQILQKAYNCIDHESRAVRHFATEFVADIARLDSRNRDTNDYLNIFGRMRSDLVHKLVDFSNTQDQETAVMMIDTYWAEFPGALPDLFIESLQLATEPRQINLAFSAFGNRIGAEKARKQIKQASFSREHFEFIEKCLGFSSNTEKQLTDLYREIQEEFKEYTPNEALNKEEVDILLAETRAGQKVLDIGFGYGRLLNPLKENGRKMYGVDLVREHVEAVKAADHSVQVMQSSWHTMPFSNGSFDSAYCLGRSILHNQTVEDMGMFLRESHRVLTEEGSLIVDIPDPSLGHYARERKRFEETAQNLGVSYFEEGSMVDSPDDQHFFDRFAPDIEQFTAMAKLAGFEVTVLKEREYRDDNNEINKNLYLKLMKSKKPLSTDDLLDLISQTKTSYAPVFLSWL